VQKGPDPEKSWYVCKRYNDFLNLHNEVVHTTGLGLSLPPKKILGNMDRNFINERKAALQIYLNSVLMNPILASSLGVRRFLDPESYVLSLQVSRFKEVKCFFSSFLCSAVVAKQVEINCLPPRNTVAWSKLSIVSPQVLTV